MADLMAMLRIPPQLMIRTMSCQAFILAGVEAGTLQQLVEFDAARRDCSKNSDNMSGGQIKRALQVCQHFPRLPAEVCPGAAAA